MVKAMQTARSKAVTENGEIMTQYLVAILHAEDYDPSVEDEAMVRDIDVLNEEMVAAGVRIFVVSFTAASNARSLRVQPDGRVLEGNQNLRESNEKFNLRDQHYAGRLRRPHQTIC